MSAENVETGNNWRYIEVGTMNLYYPAATSSFLLSPKRPDKRPTPHARRCCSGISHSPPLRTDNKRAGYATFTIDGPRPAGVDIRFSQPSEFLTR